MILGITVYFVIVKFWLNKKDKNIDLKPDKKNSSVIDELEIEHKDFTLGSENKTNILDFEIDASTYQEKSANQFLDINEDDIIDDKIQNLMGD